MGQCGSIEALSDENKSLVVESWQGIKEDLRDHGVAILLRLFEKHPDYQDKFRAFAGKPLETLSANPKFTAHALSVMFSISTMINIIHSPVHEVLHELFKKIITSHFKRDLTTAHYTNLEAVILEIIEPFLDGQKRTAWEKAFEYFQCHVETIGAEIAALEERNRDRHNTAVG